MYNYEKLVYKAPRGAGLSRFRCADHIAEHRTVCAVQPPVRLRSRQQLGQCAGQCHLHFVRLRHQPGVRLCQPDAGQGSTERIWCIRHLPSGYTGIGCRHHDDLRQPAGRPGGGSGGELYERCAEPVGWLVWPGYGAAHGHRRRSARSLHLRRLCRHCHHRRCRRPDGHLCHQLLRCPGALGSCRQDLLQRGGGRAELCVQQAHRF